MITVEEVSHQHGIDLEKVSREFDIKWAIEREQAQGLLMGPFHRKYLIERAPSDIRRWLELAHLKPHLVNAEQMFTAPEFKGFFPNANLRAAINTTTVETNLWDPGFFGRIPANTMRPGMWWEVNFGGVHGTTSTPVISFRARCGTNNSAPPTGTDLGVGPTMTLGSFTAQPFTGQGIFGVRSTGVAASGVTMTGSGFVICAGAAAATTVVTAVFGGSIPTTVDETTDQGLGVSVIWGTSSASNTITPQWMTFRTTG